jgi:hypothetical protein
MKVSRKPEAVHVELKVNECTPLTAGRLRRGRELCGRGLYLSAFRLNVSTLVGICWVPWAELMAQTA